MARKPEIKSTVRGQKPLRHGMYFASVIRCKDLAIELLDNQYPDWHKTLKIERCEILMQPTKAKAGPKMIIRGYVVRR